MFIVAFESIPDLSSLYNLTERTRKSYAFINAARTISLALVSILAIITFSYRPLLVFSPIACLAFEIRSSIDPMYRRNQVLIGSPPPISSSEDNNSWTITLRAPSLPASLWRWTSDTAQTARAAWHFSPPVRRSHIVSWKVEGRWFGGVRRLHRDELRRGKGRCQVMEGLSGGILEVENRSLG